MSTYIPWMDAVLLTLAVARLSRLLAVDVIAQPLRDLIDRRLGEDSFVARVAGCVYCNSVWFGIGWAAAYWFATDPTCRLHCGEGTAPWFAAAWYIISIGLTASLVAYQSAIAEDRHDR